jgi:GT2 family glycosyltransferase
MAQTSVIVPCWIKDDMLLKLTQRCLCSVRDTSNVELIVVDNGSTLGADYLKEEADIYIQFPKNLGYVKAINSGFKAAHGEYLVAGNNDYFMSDGWEQAMKDVLNNIPEAGIACVHTKGSPKADVCWEEPGTPGGWWMIKKELVDQIGLLDEDFFNVFADFDYIWRMNKLTGKKVMTTPVVTVQHYGEGTLSKFKSRLAEYNRGQWLLMAKWKDDPHFYKNVGQTMKLPEVEQWLKDNSEYSKSIEYSA